MAVFESFSLCSLPLFLLIAEDFLSFWTLDLIPRWWDGGVRHDLDDFSVFVSIPIYMWIPFSLAFM